MVPDPVWMVSFTRREIWDCICTEGMACEDTKQQLSKARREASEENIHDDILILDLQSPELRENKFLLFKPPVCDTLL